MSPFDLIVVVEDGRGVFNVWSRHRSSRAAEVSFRGCGREWASYRSILMDLRTGERKQRDKDGIVSEPFKAPIYDGGRFRWVDRKQAKAARV